ncbi:MAG TPA: Ku protein [Mesorhizobium sp.]|jgi:DNA end-binding protein Ku|uniref:non-homologous end joining protein Ku n=1 Tax=Mesorhizobium sp. TaxID=1871066 RepID=UPI002DDC9560|nr:Ku protein [Mesorhizobium sp.]HEV2503776.1 Ku protein [Mesorhizobium sp.]
MAPRALWKGDLKVVDIECPVALYAAASTAQRVSFHVVNRKTGNRVRREYVDEDTGKPVVDDDQMKGFDLGNDTFVTLDPDDVTDLVPASDKTLSVARFVKYADFDPLFFDRPYYLGPDKGADEAFALIRDSLAAEKIVALAQTVLFRRLRTVAIRADGKGLSANTLHFDYEIREPEKAFAKVPRLKIKKEMLDLAKHIMKSKAGSFDPMRFDDRYDAALAELIKAKIEGRKIQPPKRKPEGKVVDLMDALRRSAGAGPAAKGEGGSKRRKAG